MTERSFRIQLVQKGKDHFLTIASMSLEQPLLDRRQQQQASLQPRPSLDAPRGGVVGSSNVHELDVSLLASSTSVSLASSQLGGGGGAGQQGQGTSYSNCLHILVVQITVHAQFTVWINVCWCC